MGCPIRILANNLNNPNIRLLNKCIKIHYRNRLIFSLCSQDTDEPGCSVVLPFIYAESATLGRGKGRGRKWNKGEGDWGGGTLIGTLSLLPFALFSPSPSIFCAFHAGYAVSLSPREAIFTRARGSLLHFLFVKKMKNYA